MSSEYRRSAARGVAARRRRTMIAVGAVSVAAASVIVANPSSAAPAAGSAANYFEPGNLLLSRTVYSAAPGAITPGQTVLPAGCTTGCTTATTDATYPYVFNNEAADASFGITSPIFLDQLAPSGDLVNTLEVPNSSEHGMPPERDQLVTSFPSKSEVALNLSTDGQYVTFMGYVSPTSALDVSNSNTPGVTDSTDPVGTSAYRAVAQLDAHGKFNFTETNAYSGNNGRAAVLNNSNGANIYYTAGNAGNGGNPEPTGVIEGAGAQILTPQVRAEQAQRPGDPTPVGAFNITQLGKPADKIGKDTNFRGLTIFDNVVYLTKGSGGNGVNTVYFIDTTGRACPDGIGIPQPGAVLPTSPLAYDPSTLQANGLPTNMCILNGFPTALKSKTSFPFGLWFANKNTLYVADEGDGDATYSSASGTFTSAAGSHSAGLQKWVRTGEKWSLAYRLNSGLGLGAPYAVADYPTGVNPATGVPWAPATDGLRNITGRVNPDGSATIWAVTSTVSGSTDNGADPNRLVAITDNLGGTTAGDERFTTVRTAGFGEALRGISFTPGTVTP
jgi:hypothetical protein